MSATLGHPLRSVPSGSGVQETHPDDKSIACCRAENETLADGSRPTVWFALDESRPLAFFAGIWATWTSVRNVKKGPVKADLNGFLTSAPNAEVALSTPRRCRSF